MTNQIKSLLVGMHCEPCGNSFTHVTSNPTLDKWMVEPENLSRLMEAYCDAVENNDITLDLSEKTPESCPFVIDLYLRYPRKFDEVREYEPFSEELIDNIVMCIQETIQENISYLSEEESELLCVVLTTQEPKISSSDFRSNVIETYKIRFHFPYFVVDKKGQSSILIPDLITRLERKNINRLFHESPSESWKDMIDQDTVRDTLSLFGSDKDPSYPRMKLEKICGIISYESSVSGEEQELFVENVEIGDALPYGLHSDLKSGIIPQNFFDLEERSVNYYLPLLLSTRYCTESSKLKSKRKNGNKNNKNYLLRDLSIVDTPKGILAQLLSIISNGRYRRSTSCLEIGHAIYSAFEGDQEGSRYWSLMMEQALLEDGETNSSKGQVCFSVKDDIITEKNISSSSSSEDEKVTKSRDESDLPNFIAETGGIDSYCHEKYDSFRNRKITWKTIAWYAREDNPREFLFWHDSWAKTALKEASTTLDDSDIAEAIYRYYFFDYACLGLSKKAWYRFYNHRWTKSEGGVHLLDTMSKDFVKRCAKYEEEIANSPGVTYEKGKDPLDKIRKLKKLVKNHAPKARILSECAQKFYIEDFEAFLDSSDVLLGVANGVLEISEGTVFHRDGKPEDYIQNAAFAKYIKSYSFETPSVKKCMDWFGKIFTTVSELHHFLKYMASCIRGRNSRKVFAIFSGTLGNNSKSVFVKLCEMTFGPYCIKMPLEVITNIDRGNGSGPSPQLARAKGTRIVFLDEPNASSTLRANIIKKLTGGDSFFGRGMRKNGGDIESMFKTIMICNQVPGIDLPDKPTKERAKIFPFETVFDKDAPDDPAEQIRRKHYKADPFYESRLESLISAFLWILVAYYPLYVIEGLDDPESVIEASREYWSANDPFEQFIVDEIIRTGDPEDKVPHKLILENFNKWFKRTNPTIKEIPSNATLKEQLGQKLGKKLRGLSWTGIKIPEEKQLYY